MKFLLTTFGSFGDLHPYIAVGKGLRERGHAVTLATSEIYRAKVEGEGLAFHAVRPDMSGVIDDPEKMRRAFHKRTGTEYVIRKMFMPFVEQAFEDTLAAASGVDLIVGHALTFAVPLVSEITKTPWISIALAPSFMLSAHDPPSMPGMEAFEAFRQFGPVFWGMIWKLAKFSARGWAEPVNRLRARLGLPIRANPLMDDVFSPLGTQAWFSRTLAQPQPDWPSKTTVTGFPFYDRRDAGSGMSTELRQFLDAGPPPVVFTLGSSAVFHAGDFYRVSLRAARIAGLRAVLLIGSDTRNQLKDPPGDSVFVTDYAPYSELLPHAAATVHQGGIGTTAQALRAGRPMIVVPYSHDQPDNARCVARLGVARVVRRSQYRAKRVAHELAGLLGASHTEAARRVASDLSRENGVQTASENLYYLVQNLV